MGVQNRAVQFDFSFKFDLIPNILAGCRATEYGPGHKFKLMENFHELKLEQLMNLADAAALLSCNPPLTVNIFINEYIGAKWILLGDPEVRGRGFKMRWKFSTYSYVGKSKNNM